MNRRGFLAALGTLAGGLVLDQERLLWVPGQKTIFLPSTYVLRDPSAGIAIRFVQNWDPVSYRTLSHFDILLGIRDQVDTIHG